jgi:uncharacterized protein YPO0396
MERDIVERLREMSGPIQPNLVTEAADAIERLQAERDEAADTIKRLRGMVEELQVHADDLSANPTEERLMIETLTAERDEARYMLNLVIEAMRDNESAKQHLERLLAKFETEDRDWTWNDGNEDPEDEEETQ